MNFYEYAGIAPDKFTEQQRDTISKMNDAVENIDPYDVTFLLDVLATNSPESGNSRLLRKRANALTTQLASDGDARAQCDLGFMYMNHHIASDDPGHDAERWLLESYATGHAKAAQGLYMLYDTNFKLMKANPEKAKYYRAIWESRNERNR